MIYFIIILAVVLAGIAFGLNFSKLENVEKRAKKGNPYALSVMGAVHSPYTIIQTHYMGVPFYSKNLLDKTPFEKNKDVSDAYLLKAAEMGYLRGQKYLAVSYRYQQRYAEAAFWFGKAADRGDKWAKARLAGLYASDLVQEVNPKIIEWLKKKADGGDVLAQVQMGHLCRMEKGGLNNSDAADWFAKAAKQGNAEAQGNLGRLYNTGTCGVSRDDKVAVEWYRKSALQNAASAQFNLGLCYLNGEGVEKDKAEAKAWFSKSAAQGFENAKQILKELDNSSN